METEEKFEEGKVAETILKWYDAIKVGEEEKEDFLLLLKVAITNPTFHMEISEEDGKLDYERLAKFIKDDIEVIEQLMKDKQRYFNKALQSEVTKFKSYLGEYFESIPEGETPELEGKEQTIRNVAEEYSEIIRELSYE